MFPLLLHSCTCAPGGKGAKEFSPQRFPYVKVPSMVDPEQSVDYAAANFWNSFLAMDAPTAQKDSAKIGPLPANEVEQAMANYVSLLSSLSLEKARAYIAALPDALEAYGAAHKGSDVPAALSELVSKYLYDPNSPVRDEDIYNAFAAAIQPCTFLSQDARTRFEREEVASSLCPRGSSAAPFRFELPGGRCMNLYDIKAAFTILFFSNPGCGACKDIIEALKSDAVIQAGVDSGQIAVLNIYIDEDLAEWYNYMSAYPQDWYNGYDPDHIIRDDMLYNVRAIPSLYLLDESKVVILKDCTTEKMLITLKNLL